MCSRRSRKYACRGVSSDRGDDEDTDEDTDEDEDGKLPLRLLPELTLATAAIATEDAVTKSGADATGTDGGGGGGGASAGAGATAAGSTFASVLSVPPGVGDASSCALVACWWPPLKACFTDERAVAIGETSSPIRPFMLVTGDDDDDDDDDNDDNGGCCEAPCSQCSGIVAAAKAADNGEDDE